MSKHIVQYNMIYYNIMLCQFRMYYNCYLNFICYNLT